MYLQTTMLINIEVEYLRLVSSIQKNWKDENTNLAKAALQIIRHFKSMEGNKKAKMMQTSTPPIYYASKNPTKIKNVLKKV